LSADVTSFAYLATYPVFIFGSLGLTFEILGLEFTWELALIIGLGFANIFKRGVGMMDFASKNIALGDIANISTGIQTSSFGEIRTSFMFLYLESALIKE